jgi:hypothetical protein
MMFNVGQSIQSVRNGIVIPLPITVARTDLTASEDTVNEYSNPCTGEVRLASLGFTRRGESSSPDGGMI